MANEISTNSLMTGSEQFSGVESIKKNTAAVLSVYNNIKTSYGPYGLDKMCVDSSGSVSITNDGATILKNMLLEDPAAKLMVNLSLEQDKEVGDGTTSVVILASNLIEKGCKLISSGVHPSTVVSGYRMAFNESIKYIKEKMARKIDIVKNKEIIQNIIETCISSKIIYSEKNLFTDITLKCLENVFDGNRYFTNKINILKSVGGSMKDSEFFDGYILNCSIASQLMNKRIEKPKILFLDFSLLRDKLPITVNIQVTDPEKLEMIRNEEIMMTKRKCQAIIDSGCNLLFCTGGIDEMGVKMFTDNGITAIRRVLKSDLLVLAEATGTDVKTSIVGDDNTYDVGTLGTCGLFEVKEVGEYELCYLSGCNQKMSSVLIKGPNPQIVDEIERSLNDAIQILKRTLESKSVLAGGGTVETALSFLLEDFSTRVNLKEHISIFAYSEALLEIPKILATNAGLESSKLVSELLKKQYDLYMNGIYDKFLGLDVVSGVVQDNFVNGILEPTVYKLKALKLATEAAISILRINDIILFPSKKQH